VDEINLALISGEPARAIERRKNIAHGTLNRHREHLPTTLIAARQSSKINEADFLMAQLCGYQEQAQQVLARAQERKADRSALAAIRELVRITGIQSQITQKISEQVQDLATRPQIIEISRMIRAALQPYPEARAALEVALAKLG
jgi:ATP-dependent Lon protease